MAEGQPKQPNEQVGWHPDFEAENLYHVLGLESDATMDEIHGAINDLVKMPLTPEQRVRLNEARHRLKAEKSRVLYDRILPFDGDIIRKRQRRENALKVISAEANRQKDASYADTINADLNTVRGDLPYTTADRPDVDPIDDQLNTVPRRLFGFHTNDEDTVSGDLDPNLKTAPTAEDAHDLEAQLTVFGDLSDPEISPLVYPTTGHALNYDNLPTLTEEVTLPGKTAAEAKPVSEVPAPTEVAPAVVPPSVSEASVVSQAEIQNEDDQVKKRIEAVGAKPDNLDSIYDKEPDGTKDWRARWEGKLRGLVAQLTGNKNRETGHEDQRLRSLLEEAQVLLDRKLPGEPLWEELDVYNGSLAEVRNAILGNENSRIDSNTRETMRRLNGELHSRQEGVKAEQRRLEEGARQALTADEGVSDEEISATFNIPPLRVHTLRQEIHGRAPGSTKPPETARQRSGLKGMVERAKERESGMSERAAQSTEYLRNRMKELDAHAGEIGRLERFFRTMGEKYNKLPTSQKIALNASLALGYGLMLPVSSWLAGAYAVPLLATRFSAMAGSFMHNRARLEAISKGEAKSGLESTRLYTWLASGSERSRENKAMLKSLVTSFGLTAGLAFTAHELAEHHVAERIGQWVVDHLPGGGGKEAATSVTLQTPPEAPASAPVGASDAAHTASAAEAAAHAHPQLVEVSVNASRGHGAEWMVKRIWEQLQQQQGIDVDKYFNKDLPLDQQSDMYKLLTATPDTVDSVVHHIAADSKHGFFDAVLGKSIAIDPSAHMSLGADGQLHLFNGSHANTL